MKLIRQIYRDKFGNEWTLQHHSLPKKRGDFKFWTAESNDVSLRGESKKQLFKVINDLNNKLQTP